MSADGNVAKTATKTATNAADFDRLPSAAWTHLTAIGASGFLVFAAVARHFPRDASLDSKSSGFPSVRRLCELTKLTRRPVFAALAKLEQAGLLLRATSAGPKGTTVYSLGPAAMIAHPCAADSTTSAASSTSAADGSTGPVLSAAPAPCSEQHTEEEPLEREPFEVEQQHPQPPAAAPPPAQGVLPGGESLVPGKPQSPKRRSRQSRAAQRRQAVGEVQNRDSDFRAAVIAYPKQAGEKEAAEVWLDLKLAGALPDQADLLAAIKALSDSLNDPHYAKDFGNWLKLERWKDKIGLHRNGHKAPPSLAAHGGESNPALHGIRASQQTEVSERVARGRQTA